MKNYRVYYYEKKKMMVEIAAESLEDAEAKAQEFLDYGDLDKGQEVDFCVEFDRVEFGE